MFRLFVTLNRLGVGGAATLKTVGWFLIIGCMITVIPSYQHLAIRWPSLALKVGSPGCPCQFELIVKVLRGFKDLQLQMRQES